MSNLPSSRGTRSRFSSPHPSTNIRSAGSGNNTTADQGISQQRQFMRDWIEPPLPPPQPSFMDAGIERHGVVANMAPLGTRPSNKILKAATRPEGLDLSRRSTTARKSIPSAATTPRTMTPRAPTPEPLSESPAIDTRQRSISAKLEDQETNNPEPPSTPQAQTSARKSVPRSLGPATSQSEGQSVFSVQMPVLQSQSQPPQASSVQVTPRSTSSVNRRPPQPGYMEEENRIECGKAVESAVQQAVDALRWCTAYALRTIFDEQENKNPRMITLMMDVMHHQATETQLAEWHGVMKLRKQAGRKNDTAYYYFMGDGSDPPPSRAEPLPAEFTPTPTPAPIPFPLNLPTTLPPQFQPSGSVYKSIYTPAPALAPPAPPSIEGGESATPDEDSASASTIKEFENDDDDHPPAKKHKSSHVSSADTEVNGDATASPKGKSKQRHGSASGAAALFPNLSNRARSGSLSSLSSLSSVDEQILGDDEYSNVSMHPIPSQFSPFSPVCYLCVIEHYHCTHISVFIFIVIIAT